MSWEKLAQNRIEEAIASGEFDDLPGRGRPLDLTDYFSHSPAERAGVSLLKNAGVVPPEIELLRLAASVEKEIGRCADALQRARLNAELQEHRVAFAMAMERRRRTKGGE
jgi:hypothetical protein